MNYEIKEDWIPSIENINALPEGLKRYIMLLETNCDPAGNLLEIEGLRQQRDALLLKLGYPKDEEARLTLVGDQLQNPAAIAPSIPIPYHLRKIGGYEAKQFFAEKDNSQVIYYEIYDSTLYYFQKDKTIYLWQSGKGYATPFKESKIKPSLYGVKFAARVYLMDKEVMMAKAIMEDWDMPLSLLD